jgi:hypothetical protein
MPAPNRLKGFLLRITQYPIAQAGKESYMGSAAFFLATKLGATTGIPCCESLRGTIGGHLRLSHATMVVAGDAFGCNMAKANCVRMTNQEHRKK